MATTRSAVVSDCEPSKKRTVVFGTFQRWKCELDKDHQTMTWLECEAKTNSAGKRVVDILKCKVCTKFKNQIQSKRNYSDRWVEGAGSLRVSNIKDHAKADQHVTLFKREQAKASGVSPMTNTPIANALHRLSDDEKAKLEKKFDIAYFIATENLPFTKYAGICALESKHGVDLGSAYMNEIAGKTFCHYIAETKRSELKSLISTVKFFSVLMDGSTDKGNIDDEIFLMVWCDINGSDEKVHSRMSFLSVARPQTATSIGLFNCLQEVLSSFGILSITASECTSLVGVGTDGASANIAAGGLKGLIQKELPWVHWMRCLAHRLELAVHDALKDTTFSLIDEMLLRLYYVYEKSPKKCRELNDIIADLHEYIQFDKLNAMKRVLSKFGAYTNHLAALSTDSSTRACDKAKLRGYYNKWVDAKYLLGCALFTDLLTPCAILSKAMQKDELNILGALNGLLRTVKEIDKLSTRCLSSWTMYAATLSKIEEKEGEVTYQKQTLKNYSSAKDMYLTKYQAYCSAVIACLKSRLEWSDLDLIRDIIVILETQGWQKMVDEEENGESDPREAVDRLAVRFEKPLEAAGVVVTELRQEFKEMLEHSIQFISLSTICYQEVWWRLFHAPGATRWSNILTLAELLFSLPASNGKLERCFSTMKIVKTDRRCSLNNDTPDDLLARFGQLNTNKVPIQDFNPGAAIDLWWKAKTRRPCQQQSKKNAGQDEARPSQSDVESREEVCDTILLDDWDELLNNCD